MSLFDNFFRNDSSKLDDEEDCYVCLGDGRDEDGRKCRRCNGTGIDPG